MTATFVFRVIMYIQYVQVQYTALDNYSPSPPVQAAHKNVRHPIPFVWQIGGTYIYSQTGQQATCKNYVLVIIYLLFFSISYAYHSRRSPPAFSVALS